MKTTYRKWPKSSWIVQVYCAAQGGIEFVRVLHVGHAYSLDITPNATVQVRSVFPSADENEIADLVAALAEIQADWNKDPAPPVAPAVRRPSMLELPDL